jgi:type II secretory pathway pseudopilin PulG
MITLRRMSQRAFSAVELIGVMAILAILTALLLPQITRKTSKRDVFQTVNDAHVIEAVVAIQSIQAAATTHLTQFGSLASLNGTPLTFTGAYDKFGQVLLTEGIIERPFGLSLGTNAFLRLVNVSGLSPGSPVNGTSGAYDLNGDGKNAVVGASYLLEAVIPAVTEAEARALNDRLDGPSLGSSPGTSDVLGRVIFQSAESNGHTEVHIYVTRK